jgi:hypothetical protein
MSNERSELLDHKSGRTNLPHRQGNNKLGPATRSRKHFQLTFMQISYNKI